MRGHKSAIENGREVLFNQILQRLLKLKVGLLDVGEFVVRD